LNLNQPVNNVPKLYDLFWYLVLAHLFVKVPRPGCSEGTFSVFKSNCRPLLPV